jgi:hypothetical protein
MRSPDLEPLERRTLLAVVSASIFHDDNGNGLRDADEEPFSFSPIVIDVAQYLQIQPDGSFSAVVSAGTHLLALDAYYGERYFITTAPLPDAFTVEKDDVVSLGNVGLRLNPTQATGQAYLDANKSRRHEASDPAAVGRIVYLDLDNDSTPDDTEPQAAVDPSGSYAFAVEPGQHGAVRVAISGGEESTLIDQPTSVITVEAGLSYTSRFLIIPAGNIADSPTTDFNADGHPDLIITDPATGQPQIWLTRLGVRLGKIDLAPPGAGWTVGGAGDFAGDGKPDVLWHHDATGQSRIVTMNGTAAGAMINLPTVHPAWRVKGVGDFDADGDMDIVFRRSTTGHATVWLMDGTALSACRALPWVTNLDWTIAAVADMNDDGHCDLLWWNDIQYRMSRWQMNGTSVATFKGLPAASPGVAEFLGLLHANRDGVPDQLWGLKPWTADPDPRPHRQWGLVIWIINEASPMLPTFSRLTVA